jgi:hypothetical protein
MVRGAMARSRSGRSPPAPPHQDRQSRGRCYPCPGLRRAAVRDGTEPLGNEPARPYWNAPQASLSFAPTTVAVPCTVPLPSAEVAEKV